MNVGKDFVTSEMIDAPCVRERRISEYMAVQRKSAADTNEIKTEVEQVVLDANMLKRVKPTVTKQQDNNCGHLAQPALATKEFLM